MYKPKEEQTITCEINQEDGRIVLDFYSDCGKLGTDEMLKDIYETEIRKSECYRLLDNKLYNYK